MTTDTAAMALAALLSAPKDDAIPTNAQGVIDILYAGPVTRERIEGCIRLAINVGGLQMMEKVRPTMEALQRATEAVCST
jgi:hypothetical protein